MDIIKSKRTLYGNIKRMLENDSEENISFPQILMFTEGMGEPIFKLTIEKNENDFFIDEKGQKWVKAS